MAPCVFCDKECVAASRLPRCGCLAHKRCLAMNLTQSNRLRCPSCRARFRANDMGDAMVLYKELFSEERYKYLHQRIFDDFMLGDLLPEDWDSSELTD